MPVTLHFQSTGAVPGNAQPCVMRGTSMTLGRSDQNDIVLPDPDKVISGRHCAIEDHGGNLVVIDFSTNGTFLNYGKMALGPTPTPLNDGDILSIGAYELLVDVSAAVDTALSGAAPAIPDDAGPMLDVLGDGDDFLDDLLGTPPSGPAKIPNDDWDDDGLMPPLGDEDDFLSPARDEAASEGTSRSEHASPLSDMIQTPSVAVNDIPDDWDLDIPAAQSEGAVSQAPQRIPDDVLDDISKTIPQQTLVPVEAAVATPIETTPSIAPLAVDEGRIAAAFLNALGAQDLNIPAQEMEPTFARLGGVMRMMIHGVREILMTRASIKSEFRINQTVISAGKNNPLKFSVSPEQAVEAMIRPTTKGYLDAATATQEALNDIKAHEVAMMTGMEAALKGVLTKLEPAKLATMIEADSGFRAVLTNKKARYWDTFEKKYAEISDQAENDFHDLFSKEFARAYQEQLEKLK